MEKRIKLLLVEDESVLAAVIIESLEKEKIEVRYASDGHSGLELYKSYNPDICLIDVVMPEGDGIALVKGIRYRDAHTPLFLLSSKIETFDVLEGFKAGADDYLKKPFSMEELKARIYALVKRTKGFANSTNDDICIGSYVFNCMKQELTHKDEIKRLSQRESEILEILTSNGNITSSRKEILISLWGDDSVFNSRSLDVYMTRIRKHLIHDKNIRIVSIRGKGYRLAVQSPDLSLLNLEN